jgi:N-acetyl-gamma-glutamyl-phosphate reductase
MKTLGYKVNSKIHAVVAGGTGYVGTELVRLLSNHPKVSVGTVALRDRDSHETSIANADVVFFATPNGVAMRHARGLLDRGIKIIDLSADFRLRDIVQWEKWYNMSHACPDLVNEAVYGLSELNRKHIRATRLVANPGCYATAVILGFLPLSEMGLLPTNLIANAVSGISGAGRERAETLRLDMKENFKVYNVYGHRHLPEITQCLTEVVGKPIKMTFVTHLAPMFRGIHATLYARFPWRKIDLQGLFEQYYANDPCICVAPSFYQVETRDVINTNRCDISVSRPQNKNVVVVTSVIDNLIKGAAGQAIQNMNIMFDIAETTGLVIT